MPLSNLVEDQTKYSDHVQVNCTNTTIPINKTESQENNIACNNTQLNLEFCCTKSSNLAQNLDLGPFSQKTKQLNGINNSERAKQDFENKIEINLEVNKSNNNFNSPLNEDTIPSNYNHLEFQSLNNSEQMLQLLHAKPLVDKWSQVHFLFKPTQLIYEGKL